MEMLRSLLDKALSEGLVPFMLANAKGTPPKKNTIRIVEIALFVIPVIFFGGKIVRTLEVVTETQQMMQVKMETMSKEDVNIKLDLQRISTQLEGHLDFDRPRRYNGEEVTE